MGRSTGSRPGLPPIGGSASSGGAGAVFEWLGAAVTGATVAAPGEKEEEPERKLSPAWSLPLSRSSTAAAKREGGASSPLRRLQHGGEGRTERALPPLPFASARRPLERRAMRKELLPTEGE